MALDKSRVKLAFEQALNDSQLAATLADTLFAQSSALTAQLTTITHDPADLADYAIETTNSEAYGFATSNEARTVLAVIANLQTRLA